MRKFFKTFITFNLIIFCTVNSETSWAYVVKEGDTLSTIAEHLVSYKVYGPKGSLKKVFALNPMIKNYNLIAPGMVIVLGELDTKDIGSAKVGCDAVDRSIASSPEILERLEKLEKTEEVRKAEEVKKVEEVKDFVEEKKTTFRRGSSLGLTPYFSALGISSQDLRTHGSSTVASQYNVGMNASYVQEWSQQFHSAVNMKLGVVDFEKPTLSTRSLLASRHIMTTFGIEIDKAFNKKLNLKLNLEIGKELFIRASSTQSDIVDAVNIPGFGAKIFYEMVDSDPFILGATGTYKAKLPAQTSGYNVKFGHEYGAGLYLKQFANSTDNSQFLTEVGFTQRRQNTSISNQTETNVILNFSYFFPVGRRQIEGALMETK